MISILVISLIHTMLCKHLFFYYLGGRRGCDRIVVGFTTTCAISAYHH